MNTLAIRQETPADYKQVELLAMRAFWNIHGPGCNEHLLVRKIRQSKDYLPQLSRVAELDGKIVGAIYYAKGKVADGETTHEVITFGPLAVEPTLQNSGVGSALLKNTISLAKEAGYPGIVITGEPEYYPRLGFATCDKFGITDAEGENFAALMCLPLDEKRFSSIRGKYIESPVYNECNDPEELKQFQAEFPLYRKVKLKEGFLMLLDKRLGVIKAIDQDTYYIKFWELTIPAKLSADLNKDQVKPKAGNDVLFLWKREGLSEITSVCKNLLQE